MQYLFVRLVRIASPLSMLALLALHLPGAEPSGKGGDSGALEPEGLGSGDWSSIRNAYDAGRHAAWATQQGYRARNPGQRWRTEFDGSGFTTRPDAGGWTWGLELVSFGYPGAEQALETPACTGADGTRVTYGWTPSLDEWYLNDGRGLEHGFTVHQRPVGPADDRATGRLQFTLAVRGGLEPSLQNGARDVHFVDEAGRTVLTYSGLAAFDANGASLPAHFEVADACLRLSVDDHGAAYPLTIDPTAQQAYLKASNTDAQDLFGSAVAVSGDTVVVCAPWEDSNATGANGDQSNDSATNSGAVYVFVRSGTTWSQQAYIKASNTDPFDRFGDCASISGDTLVVGAGDEDGGSTGVDGDQNDNSEALSGAAYVFVRSGTTWSQQAYLKASNTNSLDRFGTAVSVSGDTLVVGARDEKSSATGVNGNQNNQSAALAGAAYVFVRNGSTWSQQAYLKASNTDAGDNFGQGVSVSGDTLIVGAVDEDSGFPGVNANQNDNSASDTGAAYVFVRSGVVWSQQAYLKSSNAEAFDHFGVTVCLAGDTALVCASGEDSNSAGVNANQDDNSAPSSGAAYVFVRNGTVWSQQAYLKASNPDAEDLFGSASSMSGDTVVIGAWLEDGGSYGVNGIQGNFLTNSGAAYVFTRNAATWSQQAYLKSSNPDAVDEFGLSVGVSDDVVAVGARGEASNATGVNGYQGNDSAFLAGAAYVFDLSATYEQYCHQSLIASVPGCFAQLSAHDPSLASGSWNTTHIPRSAALPAGVTLGIYIYTHGVGLGQSAFSASTPFGSLCLQGFKRSAPACAPVSLFTQPGVCHSDTMSLPLACGSGALGLAVGEDVNVQLWFRDPTSGGPQALFSNAIYYTLQ